MAARTLIGTCGWADPTLIKSGLFYPKEARTAEERLRYYAARFPLVEVDTSYYAIPAVSVVEGWAQRTPPGFVFDIKAFGLFTGQPTPVRALPPELREELPAALKEKARFYFKDLDRGWRRRFWELFAAAVLPLESAGKLGAVVLQFPQWFVPGKESLEQLLECREMLPQHRLAVEFRNGWWLGPRQREETLALLRDLDASYVCVDEPQGFKSSVPPLAAATAPLALVRLHGRNAETWQKKGLTAAERFNYLYQRGELEEWVPRVQGLAEQAQQVHILFNNCYSNQAVVNAQQMAELLGAPLGPGPAPKGQAQLI
ncbi:MAG: DUF72 domain-containing protein [Dehalococcoidia bacterium]|nr:DUF72 domain-containing protein [Dehalococcoidia bacterium]